MDVRHRRQLALMLAPYLLGLVALVGIPALVTFGLALTEYDLIRDPTFVGLDNLRELWADEVFHTALLNSVVFAAIAVPLRVGAALGLALLLHERFRGAASGRSAAILPTVVPDVAYGLVWDWLLNPLYGPITLFLGWLGPPGRTIWGLPLPQFLTHPNDARAAIIILSIFTIGEGFVLLLVARHRSPVRSTNWRRSRMRLPGQSSGESRFPCLPRFSSCCSSATRSSASSSASCRRSSSPRVDPRPTRRPISPLFVYRTGFEYLRYGYASAATVLMFGLTAAAVWLQWRVLRRVI